MHLLQIFSLTTVVALFLAISGTLAQDDDDPYVVDAGALGRIRGSSGLSFEDGGVRRPYMNFRSIPYARVTQRFSPSILLENDLGSGNIYNATAPVVSCYQPFLPEPLMSEDCLLINIYTHKKDTGNDTELRPVIFFIHGGAFTVGQGASYSGTRILNRDVVLVTFNYRLGLLGFFSLQNEDFPGNAGMYDIINALTWTNRYIKHFGGDPNAITIAGQSAGSVAVTQLMVSPMAKGLFHKAIGASGSGLNAWGTTSDPIQGALDISQRLDCYNGEATPNFNAIGECMRMISNATLFVDALFNFQVDERREGRLGFSVVSPVVQNFPMPEHLKFLPEHPRSVFEEGRQEAVPLMMSNTKHDGSYVMGVFYNRYLKANGLENNSTFLKNQLTSKILLSLGVENRPAGIHETIARNYLGDSRSSGNFQEMYPGLMDIFSVFFFKGDCYDTALQHSALAPTFWYSFDFRGTASLWGSLFPGGDGPPPFPGGVTHGDDLIYFFALTFLPFTEAEAAISSRMLSYWADFAKFSQPSSDWPQLSQETEEYTSVELRSSTRTNFRDSWVGPGLDTQPTPTDAPTTTTPTTPAPDDPFVVDAGVLGRIRGYPGNTNADGGVQRPYMNFRSIPYARVPQRFSPSVLLENDLGEGGIYNATSPVVSCYQPFLPVQFMSEDCLVINVYTHKKDTGNDMELRPVIFFIHGGAFTVGQGASYSGSRMLNRDVVLVTFNYRLGLLGFFSLQNEEFPGNAGVYDVINALKWTNKFIKHFGGDPNAITIAGQSAGSVIVTQLMASPMADGLFHKAIGASGSALNAWGTTSDPIEGALAISNLIGCYNGSSAPNFTEIGTCMRQVSNASLFVDTLFNYQVAERKEGRLGFSVVSPVVQNFPLTHEKFLPEHPRVVFEEGRQAVVPLMMSNTKHDGSYVMGVFYNRFLKENGLEEDSDFLKNQLTSQILLSLGVFDRPSGIHEAIARTYLGDSRTSGDFQEMYPGLMDIFSVFFFKGDCYQIALQHSALAPTFWSSFDFRGTVSLWNSLFPGGDGPPPFPGGVTHGDDLIYLFALTFIPFTEIEATISSRMLSYWADFAKFSQPSPDWPQLNIDTEDYMGIEIKSASRTQYQTSWVGPGYETQPSTEEPNQQSSTATTPIETDPTTEESNQPSSTTTIPTSTEVPTTTTEVPTTTNPTTPTNPTNPTTPTTTESIETTTQAATLHQLTPLLALFPFLITITRMLTL